MGFDAHAVTVLISTPSDTSDEQSAVQIALGQWNVDRGEDAGVVFVPWIYSQHAIPGSGASPQELINPQIERSDVVVAIFDTRLGTETARAVSGSAEELLDAIDQGKPVHVYFSEENLPFSASGMDPKQLEQIQKLVEFRKTLNSKSLSRTYTSPADLAGQVLRAMEYDLKNSTWRDTSKPDAAPLPAPQLRETTIRDTLEVRNTGGDTYAVSHSGNGRAYAVTVGPAVNPGGLSVSDFPPTSGGPKPRDLEPGDDLSFFVSKPGANVTDRRLKITWHNAESDSSAPSVAMKVLPEKSAPSRGYFL